MPDPVTTLAIIGAGPGLGAAVARAFGAHGYGVALVSRTQTKLDDLADRLGRDGASARGYAADVRDPDAPRRRAAQRRGGPGPDRGARVQPHPQREFLKPVLETTPDDIRAAVQFSVFGPMAAVGTVLPGMRDRG